MRISAGPRYDRDVSFISQGVLWLDVAVRSVDVYFPCRLMYLDSAAPPVSVQVHTYGVFRCGL